MLYLAGFFFFFFSSGSKLFDVIMHHGKFLLDQFDGKQVMQSEHTHCSTEVAGWTRKRVGPLDLVAVPSGLGSCPLWTW